MSEGTYYRWNAKYGGMDVNATRRLKELELEKRRLKAALADVTHDKQALKEALQQMVTRVAVVFFGTGMGSANGEHAA